MNRAILRPPSLPNSPVIINDLKNLSDLLPDPLVCLTFDDGPDPVFTPAILDILAEQKVHATFFVLGEFAENYPQLVERMAAEGHTVGNHTYSHHHPWLQSAESLREEMTRTSDIIHSITGHAPHWFRPPHGRVRKIMLDECHEQHMRMVLWNRSIIDWGPLGTETAVARRLREVESGDIVLMHDGQRQHNRPQHIARSLPEALKSLARRGVVPVTLDQVAFCL